MNTFQFAVFILTIVSVICNEKQSTNEKLQDIQLNQGEYFPSEEELKEQEGQYGYKSKSNRYYSPEQQEGTQFMIIKRTKKVPTTKRYMIAHPAPGLTPHQHSKSVAYAAVHRTKILPVKVIQEGPIKHVYLPEYYDDQSAQIKLSRTARAHENINQAYKSAKRASYNNLYPYKAYNPGLYQQNYFRPSLQYNYLPHAVSGFNQASLGHGYNSVSNGYRVGKSNEITPLFPEYRSQLGYSKGLGNNLYPAAPQYFPQTFSSQIPSYKGGYKNKEFSYSNGISNTYKSLISDNSAYKTGQYDQFQGVTPAVSKNLVPYRTVNIQPQNSNGISNQYKSLISGQSNNSTYTTSQYGQEGQFAPVSRLDPELAKIFNEVLQGKRASTHDGFTMVKSKTDNAIYLIGKPGMSLSTIPNISAFNYASFQKDDKSTKTKTKDKKNT